MYIRRFLSIVVPGLMTVSALATAQMHGVTGTHPAPATTSPYLNKGHSSQAALHYASTWGVEQLQVRYTESGTLLRFSYRVVDANRAKVLHDKKAEPHLIGLRSHAMLSVPTLENVGQLRQTEALQNGKDYWVLFSNKGNLVRIGDRVDVVIGDFYASGLTVE